MTQENLPGGWVGTKINHICEIIGGGTPSRKNPEYFNGDTVWLTPTEIPKNSVVKISDSREKITERGLQKSSAKIIPKNSVLLTSRASIGYVAIAGTDLTTNQGFASFVCSNAVHNFYLAHWLTSKKNLLKKEATGTTFKEISKSKLRMLDILLPPLNEQRRIVSRLESIFSRIDACRGELERLASQTKTSAGSLETLRSSVLKQAFEGRLVHQDPDDEPADLLLKRINKDAKELVLENDDLPDGWIKVHLEDMSTIILGQSPPSSTYNKERIGLPFFQGKADFGHVHPVARTWCDAPKKTSEKGDILISVRAPVGSTNIAVDACCIGRGLAAIRPLEMADTMYVFYYLRHLENHISQQGTGTTFKAITGKQLRTIALSLPPVAEQKRIVSRIESIFSGIDAIEQTVNQSISALGALKQSVLKQAFEGKLVPQDPADEPASVLLERIKNAKPKVTKGKKHGK